MFFLLCFAWSQWSRGTYVETNGQSVELDRLVPHILATFIEADRGFQTWRKSAAGKATGAD